MVFIMTNNELTIHQYQELNLFAAFLFIAALAVIVWYIQWSREHKSNH